MKAHDAKSGSERARGNPRCSIIARFGASVQKLRLERGITQEQLAERADLHRTYIADIERGAQNVSLRSIEKLAEALGVRAAELFALTGAHRPHGYENPHRQSIGDGVFADSEASNFGPTISKTVGLALPSA